MENTILNIYNKSIKSERKFIIDNIMDKWIDIKTKYPSCDKLSLKLKKVKSLPNPIKFQCNQ